MARKPRIHYDGALYHVLVRGNNRSHIFRNKEDKENYKKIVLKYKKRYHFKLYAYCIMDNHAHLLIKVTDIPLSKIMQGIQQVFTQKYNRINNTTGHVFEQRYKAFLCAKDIYLLSLIRYIHQNPVRAHLVDALNYQWSSHQEYLGNPQLADVHFPLSLFDIHRGKALKRYLAFMDELETKVIESMKKEEDEIEEPKNTKKSPKVASDTLIKIITEVTKIEIEKIRGNAKSKTRSDIRKLYITTLKKYTDLPNKEIASLLGIGTSAVSNVLAGRYQENDFIINSSREIEKHVNL
ncbi:MAG: transposase [Atribacterota bacterium]|nr:transposase [Atribacterota bacterium]MDD4895175.1 transposase [Atribacterota bacterium]MDD5636942.1 transposase [Atribacterota bacterium]